MPAYSLIIDVGDMLNSAPSFISLELKKVFVSPVRARPFRAPVRSGALSSLLIK